MALPDFTNRRYLSAGVLNEWMRSLLNATAWCGGPRGGFAMLPEGGYSADNDGELVTVWNGRMLYTGLSNTLRYSLYLIANGGSVNANANIYVGGTLVAEISDATGHTQSGTVTLSGLTAGTVYTVQVKANRTGTSNEVPLEVDVYWLGLTYTPAYTEMITWQDGDTVSAANLHKIRDNILAVWDGAPAMPAAPTAVHHRAETPSDGDKMAVWRGYFYAVHDRIRVRCTGHAKNGKGVIVVWVNGTEVGSFQQTNDESLHDAAFDHGIAPGNFFRVDVRMGRDGTSATDIDMDCEALLVEEVASAFTPMATTPFETMGTVTAAQLLTFNGNINLVHPGAVWHGGAAPGYFEQPAILQGDDRRYTLQHRRGWLRYVGSGSGTPEITPFDSGAAETKMPADETEFLLANAPGLGMGSYYTVDDAYYAQEWDYAQT